MLGLKYEYYQYFSYQDLQQLKEILTYDSIGEVKFYEDEKVIEYKINKSNCILLSELIELINGFHQISFGIGVIAFHSLVRESDVHEKKKILTLLFRLRSYMVEIRTQSISDYYLQKNLV
ncbi:unnamed protein product (macronuclear) [Paramecium tetraurelia]|uniref:Uncharacterized protein n=1 Tax=Paramecium tetraurelia TaxID=5888 RepID=A0CC93_PARTE|nr:uncharacterized protein GSPATT00037194001 [Paramecium tetraurelia]CAK68410.1 unnamed protein product [Paramecium tetraurelia]|eukprot:XP_001435807.1 hypothetical protein (macronuclear) [Paramecium tetraurelia strain d4-2]